MSMTDTQCAETPLSDHVARFWKYLENETVRIVLDLKRTVGTDAPDGPLVYWDGATFSDDVAKALVAERAESERLRADFDALFAERTRLRTALFETRPYVPEHHGPVQARIAEALGPIHPQPIPAAT